MSGNLETTAPAFTKNTSANISLENLLLINLNQFSYDLAPRLQQKNNDRHQTYIERDKSKIDNIEKTFQPVLTELREKEFPLTTKKLLLAIAASLKKQTISRQFPTNKQHFDVVSSSDNTKTFSTIFHWFWPSIPKLNKIFQFIEANYNQHITLSVLATEVGYSENYLCNLVKSKTARTIHKWIVERRMLLARYELLTTNKTVTKIAETVGYEDPGHFMRQFRKTHNTSPKMWRNIRRAQKCIHPFNKCPLIGMQIVKTATSTEG